MSMDFSEFTRRLGAEPSSDDPELVRARASSPEFEQAAQAADAFEKKLAAALGLSTPDGLQDDILAVANVPRKPLRWKPFALAASLLLAVGAAGITMKMNRSWDSIDDYLAAHYSHDGAKLLALADGHVADNVESVLLPLDFEATADLSDMVSFIKYCPTPDGKGVHMVLNTRQGPVTVILMPDTSVTDTQVIPVDGMQAYLVSLKRGSAAIIAADRAMAASLGPMLRNSIIPVTNKA